MAKITVDGKVYEVNPEHNLLQECLSLGLDLPYFCWHPCMGSVGACRQCAVKQYRNAEDVNGTLVMACMTPASDGAIISVNDSQARDFRAAVIESLMISHPHDCPVCEEGGECHLQDMTLMSGHNYRRYDREKVTHNNQYLGPFIGHEMNRCITCYRCVRYYNDYAGGTDLSAQACHHHVYFGRQTDGVLESEFSGNLVEVCPTGVFTDATFSAHYSRKWDLQTAPSICVGCAAGCNTTPGERYGSLRRIVNRYHGDVNGYFLCDRGRFGYGFVNEAARLKEPLQRQQGIVSQLSVDEARARLLAMAGDGCIGIGSPRAGVEANFSLRQLVGPDNFYLGMDEVDQHAAALAAELATVEGISIPSLREVEQADAVIIVGEDVTNSMPRLALALRQTVRNKAFELARAARIPQWQDAAVRELAQSCLTPVYQLCGYGTRLDDIVTGQWLGDDTSLGQVAAAVATLLDAGAPGGGSTLSAEAQALVAEMVAVLGQAKRPLVITGSGAGSSALMDAAANLALALRNNDRSVGFCCVMPEVNSLGLSLLAGAGANSLSMALQRMATGKAQRVIVLENDLYRRATRASVDAALARVAQLAVIDQLPTATTDAAGLVLPSTSFAEQPAALVNYEGRAQLSYQVYRNDSALPAWQWLQAETGMRHFNALIHACADAQPALAGLVGVLPDTARWPAGFRIPRQPHRYSGRTAMTANLAVNEPQQPVDPESPLSFSMEGASVLKDSSILASAWAPGWNSNQSISKFQDEVAGPLRQASGESLLFADRPKTAGRWRNPAPAPATGDGLLAVRALQIFGSDELSARAAPIRSRMSGSYVALSPTDAAGAGLRHGQRVTVTGPGARVTAAVVLRKRIRPGTVALYCEEQPGEWAGLRGRVELRAETTAGAHQHLTNLILSDLLQETN